MLDLEILVREGFGAVDGRATGAITVEEISTLDHETFDLPGDKAKIDQETVLSIERNSDRGIFYHDSWKN